MSWKAITVIGVVLVLTVLGIYTASQSQDTATPRPTATATLAGTPTPGVSESASSTAAPLPTEDMTAAGEQFGDMPVADIDEAKAHATSFLQAVETYGPGITLDQALKNASKYMSPKMVDGLEGDDPMTDAEYDELVASGKTRVIEVQKLFVTSTDTKAKTIKMVATLRSGWVPAGNASLPTDQPAYRMIVIMSHTSGAVGWGALDYRPTDF